MKITNKYAKKVVEFKNAGKSMESVMKWWNRTVLGGGVNVNGETIEFLFPESVFSTRGGYHSTGNTVKVLEIAVW